MSEPTSEAMRAWFKRVQPVYPELFNTAHAICGNYDQAEYAMRSAILEVWSQNADGGMGFREKLRGEVREEALRLLRAEGGAEFTWSGFQAVSDSEMLRQASREPIEIQRLLMLRHGVGLSPGRIGPIMGMTAAQVRTALDRFESRCRRVLPAQDRSRFDALFARAAKRQLASRVGVPHPGQVYRAFEAEAAQLQVSDRRVPKLIYRVLLLLMSFVCAVMFWLFAVLVQSPGMETAPAVRTPAATEAPSETELPSETETPFTESPASIETTTITEG